MPLAFLALPLLLSLLLPSAALAEPLFNAAGNSRAFPYADGRLQDLDLLVAGLDDFRLTEAVGIDERGQIVAHGCKEFGLCAPVLLTPVPEAAMASSLLAGLPLLARGLLRAVHRR